jgi:transposase
MTTRKKYSKEYKLDTVSLVMKHDYTRSQAAGGLDMKASMLGRSMSEHQDDEWQRYNERSTVERVNG